MGPNRPTTDSGTGLAHPSRVNSWVYPGLWTRLDAEDEVANAVVQRRGFLMVNFSGLDKWEESPLAELLVSSSGREYDPYHFGSLQKIEWRPGGVLALELYLTEYKDLVTGSNVASNSVLWLEFGGVRNLESEQDTDYAEEQFDEVDYYFGWQVGDGGVARVTRLVAGGLEMSFTCSEVRLRIKGQRHV